MEKLPIKFVFQFLILFFTFELFAQNVPNFPKGFKPKDVPCLSFTENKGQVTDQNNKPRPDVLFVGLADDMAFHLHNNGISYQLSKVSSWKSSSLPDKKGLFKQKENETNLTDQTTVYRLDINWLNCNQEAVITKGKKQESYNNYYLENCPAGALHVNSYENITYQNIYTGIDLKWYEKDGNLKYDYFVAAGADYKKIQFEVKGADSISLNNKGGLVLKTPLGNIIENAPLVIQNRKILISEWVIKNNIVSLNIKNIDHSKPFIIDPVIRAWGTYYGGPVHDYGQSCAIDSLGNVYLAGYTDSNTGMIIATTGSHQSIIGGGYDAFLVQFNNNGVRQWGTYYGGGGDDYGYSCATTRNGDVYLSGSTYSVLNGTVIATAGSHQSAGATGLDAFLAKFNVNGIRQWSTYYGGGGDDITRCCVTDSFGNVYMAGSTNSTYGIATTGSHQNSLVGLSSAFLVKFNQNGLRLWGTYYGADTYGFSCAVDNNNKVCLTGYTRSASLISTPGSHQPILGGAEDAFLVQFNSNGTRQWGTYYGGIVTDVAYACSTDPNGNIYMTGWSNSVTGIATLGSHQSVTGGNDDAFLVKFDNTGVRQWGTYYGGTNSSWGTSCITDAASNVYLYGNVDDGLGTTIATLGSYQPLFGGSWDVLLVKFDQMGVRQWGTYYGTINREDGNACAVDGFGNIYIAGESSSNTGTVIASAGSYQPNNTGFGYTDGFLVKLTDCTALPPTDNTLLTNKQICAGYNTMLSVTGIGSVNWYSSSTSTVSLGTGLSFSTPTLTAGSYSYYAESIVCSQNSVRIAITVTVNPIPIISVNSGSICAGNSFTIIPIGANTFSIQGGAAVVSPSSNNNYTVVGTSAEGCTSTNFVTASVTVNPVPIISVNSGSICAGNSFTIIPIGVNTFSIQGGAAVVSPGSSSNYTVVGISAEGCISGNIVTSTVTVNPIPTVNINNGIICSGESFTLLPTGATTYSIQGGLTIVSPISNSNYTVVGISAFGCISSNTATSSVIVNATPVISVNSGTICSGNSYTIFPAGAVTYTIQGGNAVVSPSVSSSYTVIGTSVAGCLSTNVAISNIIVNPTPTISAVSSSSILCAGQTASLTASGAITYTWNTMNTNFVIAVSPTVNTTYTVTGTNSTGCTNTISISQIVDLCTGISNANIQSSKTKLFPNPTCGIITIELPENSKVIVLNSLSEVIYNENLILGQHSVDFSNICNGIYFVKVILNKKEEIFKLIKE